jgi:hypothetical protein
VRIGCDCSNPSLPCRRAGYREAAVLTRQKRTEKVFSTLLRISSTVSLLDVKIEDPPLCDANENVDPKESAGQSSARLLFGRPPIKTLLRRSTRTALRDSISYRLKSRFRVHREYVFVGREKDHRRRHVVMGKIFTYVIKKQICAE